MKEGKIHAIITTGIGLAAFGLWIADACLAHSEKGYALLSVPAFLIFLLISNVFHYIDPDRGLRQNNGETVFFGHFNSAYQKTFDQYDERDLWFWRLWGYIEQFFFLVIAVVLFFVIVSNHF
jgi:hypothetical protein